MCGLLGIKQGNYTRQTSDLHHWWAVGWTTCVTSLQLKAQGYLVRPNVRVGWEGSQWDNKLLYRKGERTYGYSDCWPNCQGLEIILLAGTFFSLLFSFLEHTLKYNLLLLIVVAPRLYIIEDNYCVICFSPSFDWQYIYCWSHFPIFSSRQSLWLLNIECVRLGILECLLFSFVTGYQSLCGQSSQ